MEYAYKLTEEISRWAFEINVKNNPDWWIAFTNPTAGPWKRLIAPDLNGIDGEVYRFDRDEKRPDIVIVNDKTKSIVIFEAKDTLDKLITASQASKSAKVIDDMASVLANINNNKYWRNRSEYKIYNGLLWGTNETTDQEKLNKAFKIYRQELVNLSSNVDSEIQIGVASQKNINFEINLNFYVSGYSNEANELLESLKSFK